jgi:hypothetical protein
MGLTFRKTGRWEGCHGSLAGRAGSTVGVEIGKRRGLSGETGRWGGMSGETSRLGALSGETGRWGGISGELADGRDWWKGLARGSDGNRRPS